MGIANIITGRDITGTEQQILVTTDSDALTVGDAAAFPMTSHALQYEFNEFTYERTRGNTSRVLMAATSVSASTAVTVTNYGRGIIAWADITSGLPPGSASTTFALKVQAVSPVGTNRWVTLATTTARSVSGIVACAVGPALTETSGVAYAQANRLVPRDVRILASISSAAASFGCVLALGLSTIK